MVYLQQKDADINVHVQT